MHCLSVQCLSVLFKTTVFSHCLFYSLVVWGVVIAGSSEDNSIKGKDWGFAFMSYILLNAIRFFLVFSFYPVTARIGIGTDWQEAVFSSYA